MTLMVTKVHDHDDETFMKVMMVLMEQNYICQKTMGLFDNTFSKLCDVAYVSCRQNNEGQVRSRIQKSCFMQITFFFFSISQTDNIDNYIKTSLESDTMPYDLIRSVYLIMQKQYVFMLMSFLRC